MAIFSPSALAIPELKKAIEIRPHIYAIHLDLVATYIHLGREEEARAEATEVLRINPKFSLEHFSKTIPLIPIEFMATEAVIWFSVADPGTMSTQCTSVLAGSETSRREPSGLIAALAISEPDSPEKYETPCLILNLLLFYPHIGKACY